MKRKERELEHEMERLAREKISLQQRLAIVKKEITSHYDNVDFTKILPDVTYVTQGSISSSDGVIDSRAEVINHSNGGTSEKVIPILAKTSIPVVTQTQASIKEVSILITNWKPFSSSPFVEKTTYSTEI